MRYLSPASLPGISLTNLRDTKALQLQKKMLLAELELSADGRLRIAASAGHGANEGANAGANEAAAPRALDKNEILQYFETLQDETILPYHEAISKDTTLREFLEYGVLNTAASFAQSSLYDDAAFRQWISPYFYTAFTEYVFRCLEVTDEPALRSILRNQLLLTDYDREQAWVRIGQMLEDNIATLEHYQDKDRKDPNRSIDDISVLITDSLTRMILLFPPEPFSEVRNKYAFYIMQVCIFVFNNQKQYRDFLDAWMQNAQLLAASEELESEIAAKHQEMKTLREKSRRNKTIRFGVGFALILFQLLSTHPFSSNDNIPAVTTFIYNGDTIHSEKDLEKAMNKHSLIDSLNKIEQTK